MVVWVVGKPEGKLSDVEVFAEQETASDRARELSLQAYDADNFSNYWNTYQAKPFGVHGFTTEPPMCDYAGQPIK